MKQLQLALIAWVFLITVAKADPLSVTLRFAESSQEGSFDVQLSLYPESSGPANAVWGPIVTTADVAGGIGLVSIDTTSFAELSQGAWLAVAARRTGSDAPFAPALQRFPLGHVRRSSDAAFAVIADDVFAGSIASATVQNASIGAEAADTETIQARIAQVCDTGQAMFNISAEGTPSCGAVPVGPVGQEGPRGVSVRTRAMCLSQHAAPCPCAVTVASVVISNGGECSMKADVGSCIHINNTPTPSTCCVCRDNVISG